MQHDGERAKPCPHPFVTGASVRHDIFGTGQVIKHTMDSVNVWFDMHGQKDFVVQFAAKRMRVVTP